MGRSMPNNSVILVLSIKTPFNQYSLFDSGNPEYAGSVTSGQIFHASGHGYVVGFVFIHQIQQCPPIFNSFFPGNNPKDYFGGLIKIGSTYTFGMDLSLFF